MRKQPSLKTDATVYYSIRIQHLKLEGNLENPSAYGETRRTHTPPTHDLELFQKESYLLPSEILPTQTQGYCA